MIRHPLTAGALAAEVTRTLVAHYLDAARGTAEADARHRVADPRHDREVSCWNGLLHMATSDARDNLLRAIVAWTPGLSEHVIFDAEKRRFATCGVRLGGKLYLAVPDEELAGILPEGERRPDNVNLMRLTIVEPGAIVDLDDAP